MAVKATRRNTRMMNKDKYDDLLDEMREYVKLSREDEETAHERGDEILCQLLREVGYDEIVDEWELIRKWYA